MLVRKVKRKPRSFEANLGGSLYSTLNHLSNHAFYYKWLQTRPIQGNGSAGQMSVETHEASQNSFQVVQPSSSELKSIHISFEIRTTENAVK